MKFTIEKSRYGLYTSVFEDGTKGTTAIIFCFHHIMWSYTKIYFSPRVEWEDNSSQTQIN